MGSMFENCVGHLVAIFSLGIVRITIQVIFFLVFPCGPVFFEGVMIFYGLKYLRQAVFCL